MLSRSPLRTYLEFGRSAGTDHPNVSYSGTSDLISLVLIDSFGDKAQWPREKVR